MPYFRYKPRWLMILMVTMSLCLLQRLYRYSDSRQYRHNLDHAAFQVISKKLDEDALGFLSRTEAANLCRAHNWGVYRRFPSRRKAYDLFIVNNELDMLKIRLNELYPYVDYFVILEAKTTFTGLLKPMIPNETWETDFQRIQAQDYPSHVSGSWP